MLFSIKQYDLFISYVVEDREIVEELYEGLTRRKLRIWYAKQQLYPGADIVQVIQSGLHNVRFGAIIISPLYTGHWSGAESFALMSNKKRLIPILYNTSFAEAALDIPGLGDIYCLDASVGIDVVVEQICKQVKPKSKFYYVIAGIMHYIKNNVKTFQWLCGLIFFFLVIIAVGSFYYSIGPSTEFVEAVIKERQNQVEALAKNEFEDNIAANEYSILSLNELLRITPNGNRKLIFYNGIDYIQSVAGLKNAGIIPTIEPIVPPFGLSDYKAFGFNTSSTNFAYGLINLIPQQYKIMGTRLDGDIYEIDVHNTNAIRYIDVTVYEDTIRRPTFVAHFYGAKPDETYVFEKSGENWKLLMIR